MCKFVAYRRIYNFSCVTSCHVLTSILEKLILFSTTGICNRIRNCARNVISKLFRNMHIKFSFTYEYIPQMLFFRWFARYTTFNSLEEYYLFFIKKNSRNYANVAFLKKFDEFESMIIATLLPVTNILARWVEGELSSCGIIDDDKGDIVRRQFVFREWRELCCDGWSVWGISWCLCRWWWWWWW